MLLRPLTQTLVSVQPLVVRPMLQTCLYLCCNSDVTLSVLVEMHPYNNGSTIAVPVAFLCGNVKV